MTVVGIGNDWGYLGLVWYKTEKDTMGAGSQRIWD